MIQDLHSHTYYSFCSHDPPTELVETAISAGIEILGICDHNYGIALQRSVNTYPDDERRRKDYQRSIIAYHDHIQLIANKYQDKIKVISGIEIATLSKSNWPIPDDIDISMFDYCLIESIDRSDSVAPDLFSFAKRCATKQVGVAHTDLFAYLEATGQDPLAYFTRMADSNIFWEINVNYDTTHHYRFHSYVLNFFQSEWQREIIRKSGVKLSVGFDSHKIQDYRPDVIHDYCRKISDFGIPLVFSENQQYKA